MCTVKPAQWFEQLYELDLQRLQNPGVNACGELTGQATTADS